MTDPATHSIPAPGNAREAVKEALEAIDVHEPRLNAVAAKLEPSALADACHRDQLADSGVSIGPLHGLPCIVKDIIDVAGTPTRSGSLTRTDNPPAERDAPVVAALRAAGAIPIAKSNTVEFAIGGWGTNHTVGTPVNPWSRDVPLNPGGSSSGTGVLVGAGLVAAGLGTDTGGSVRLPAAFCGCVGLKTSIGLVSRTGATPLSETLDTVGPLTTSVRLAAGMLAVMQGPDLVDPTTLGHVGTCPLHNLERGLQGLRLARIKSEAMPYLSQEMAAAFAAAIKILRDAGATITECELPLTFDEYQRLGSMISASEAYATYADIVDDPDSPMGEANRRRMARGKSISAHELVRLRRQRDQAIADFEAVIDANDAIILPTTPFTAIPITDVDEMDLTYGNHTRLANFLELAALSVPINLTPAGLPTSLQVVVRRFDDPLALRIGHAFELARGPFPKPQLQFA